MRHNWITIKYCLLCIAFLPSIVNCVLYYYQVLCIVYCVLYY